MVSGVLYVTLLTSAACEPELRQSAGSHQAGKIGRACTGIAGESKQTSQLIQKQRRLVDQDAQQRRITTLSDAERPAGIERLVGMQAGP